MNTLSLKTKMALAVSLLFLLVIALLSWCALAYQERSLKNAISRQQFALVSSLAENIDDKLRLAHGTLIAAARQVQPSAAGSADRAQRFLDARITLLSIFDNGLFLISSDGRLIAESPYLPGRRGRDDSHQEFYQQTVKTGKPYISKPYTSSRTPGHPAIFLSAPVFDRHGRLTAILGGSFDLWGSNFLQELSRTRYSETGYFYLTDRDRTIIVHPDKDRILPRALPAGTNAMYEKALAGFEGSGETVNSDGVRVISSVRHLRTTGWILAANYPTSEAYASMAAAKRYFLLATVGLTIAVLTITWLLMKRFTGPLEAFTRHVESVPEKFGEHHSLEIGSNDEIGILGQAFNRMVTTLESQQAALRESEEKFSKAFHLAPSLFALTNLNDGRIIEVNEAFERLFGYRREEIIGRSTLDLDIWNNPADRDRLIGMLRDGREVREQEITFRDRTGNLLVGLYSAAIIDVHGDKYLLSLHNDITARKRAEEALRESEVRYRTLVEGANDAICTIRDGCFVNCNRKALEMFRCTAEEFIGRRPEHLSPPMQPDGIDSASKAREKVVQALAGPPQFFEWRHLRSDGTLFDVEISLNRLEYQGKTELLAIIRDITERKRAEEALKVSEAEKSLILNSTIDLVVYHDADMKILWGNLKALDSVGMQPEELTGRQCWELWHQRTEPCVGCPVVLARDTGQPQEAEIRSPDGRQWYIRGFPIKDDDGKVKGVVEFCLDVTGRKRAEEALQESEEKFAKAFRATPSILVISTIAEGRYIEVNEAFERILGYRRDEVVGRTSLELNIWETPEARSRFLQALREDGKVRDLEANFRGKRGDHFVGLLSSEVIEIKGEQCLLILVNDITERKRMEAEIEILNTDLAARAAELEAANQELEAFNYTVSHDLRTPLSAINSCCQIMMELDADAHMSEGTEFIRLIHEAVWRMNGLISALLDFSRLSRVELSRERVDLTEMAKAVVCQLRMSEPERRALFTAADGVEALGDPRLLRIVLENLLGNAWKYTVNRETAEIEFGVTEADGKPVCFVRDNGPGFATDDADRLFRPFQRLAGAENFPGHGIGLAAVKRIIQRHGGRVWAEGEVGKGATFFFTL
ncbi:MAG: PAS/PAC sensor signal transduction histidine [Geobacteraceae bacterium]|nr:MAG: PAS/PAC sensor signal transduction histidine [Geobacteraceae bacterium]